MFWFKRKPAPKKPKPHRISVHLPDGRTFVHYAVYRTQRANGGLTLHDEIYGGCVVADYAAGCWSSVSIGTRRVSR